MSDTHSGVVVAFDGDRGWGTIEADDGTRLGFHCALIADGSRTIEVGVRVRFGVLAKLGGREARDVAPA